jgi:2'-5' RNA ligase
MKKKMDLREFLRKHKNDEIGSFETTKIELIESVLSGGSGPVHRTIAVFEAE